jgi:hypothetical protein
MMFGSSWANEAASARARALRWRIEKWISDLVQPAGVNGQVNHERVAVGGVESVGGGLATMRAAVVDDPEDNRGQTGTGGHPDPSQE